MSANNNDKDFNKINNDFDILRKEVNHYKELTDERIKAYRNYLIIFITVASLGGGVIFYSIRNVVENTAKEKFDEVLTTEYIEEQIKEKSTNIITKLTEETESKAKEIVKKYSTFDDLRFFAAEALVLKDYGNAVSFYKQAIKKALIFSDGFDIHDKNEIALTYLWLAIAQSFNSQYEEALLNTKNASSLATTDSKIAIMYFLECVIGKILDKTIPTVENKFSEILKTEFKIYAAEFDTDEFEEWLEDVEITEDKKAYIFDKITLIKKHIVYRK
ncbi:MAG: hypothetical protein ACUZ8I_02105 [Candidatus Scalindua sp.]